MQSYVMKLTAGATRSFGVKADLFVYESGAATPAEGDTRIRVKPDTGAEMVLRPGQRFRLAPGSEATRFEVSALDAAVSLDGYVVIGSGEFDDANTLNKFTLDATLTNNVTVTNTTAQRLPVNLDLTQRLPVALDPTAVLNTNQNTMLYTNSFATTARTDTAQQVVAAATNVNGVDLKQLAIIGTPSGAGYMYMLAKATAPTGPTDGDLLDVIQLAATPTVVKSDSNVRAPAGKAVWLYCAADQAAALHKSVLFTVL